MFIAACGQITIKLDKVPANTPAGSKIYVAGNFNFWDPGDDRYIMDYNKQNGYSITLPVSFGSVEYKFTRGDWSTVECDRCGNDISNRKIVDFDNKPIHNKIESWADLEPLDCDSVLVILSNLPKNTPKDAEIKIAGNFNAWNLPIMNNTGLRKTQRTENIQLCFIKKMVCKLKI